MYYIIHIQFKNNFFLYTNGNITFFFCNEKLISYSFLANREIYVYYLYLERF